MKMKIGDRLAQLRKEKGYSMQEMANRLGIAKSTYAGYESNYREPSLDMIKKMAGFFDVSTDYLLGRSDDTVDIYAEFRRIRESIPKWGENAGQIALDETKKVLIKLIERGELTPVKAKPIIAFLDAMIEEFESDDGPDEGPSQKSDNN